ncbi:hypothetical protein JCGZ_03868 [Jatropha curcas]|uniref:Uncharacterized protein n=1 Tax=Jatropha curcas TaxID=180498 RepID=A0A067JA51_JATCU|nr:hypothetical protein JCGZ_03868 [Jatropha curcas]
MVYYEAVWILSRLVMMHYEADRVNPTKPSKADQTELRRCVTALSVVSRSSDLYDVTKNDDIMVFILSERHVVVVQKGSYVTHLPNPSRSRKLRAQLSSAALLL